MIEAAATTIGALVGAREGTGTGDPLMPKSHPIEPVREETRTVFVVDDDLAILEVMDELLQQNGYAVQLFASGSDFLDFYLQ